MTDRKSSFEYEDLIAHANGELMGPDAPQLPLPPMLMIDRISSIGEDGGEYGKGHVHAEYAINRDRWFFDCHFKGDPVMPGCLGLDGMWQLTGFYIGWLGCKGKGRAIGVGDVKLTAMVTPEIEMIKYEISMRRVITRKLVLAIADGRMYADGELAYEVSNMKVGIFSD